MKNPLLDQADFSGFDEFTRISMHMLEIFLFKPIYSQLLFQWIYN